MSDPVPPPASPAEPCGGCGNADPDKVCIGCLHFATPPASPAEAYSPFVNSGNATPPAPATDEEVEEIAKRLEAPRFSIEDNRKAAALLRSLKRLTDMALGATEAVAIERDALRQRAEAAEKALRHATTVLSGIRSRYSRSGPQEAFKMYRDANDFLNRAHLAKHAGEPGHE